MVTSEVRKDVGQWAIDSFKNNAPYQFVKVLEEQRQKGIKKYGKPCDCDEGRDWKVECAQELADSLVYCMCSLLSTAEPMETARMQTVMQCIADAVGALYIDLRSEDPTPTIIH